jgi:hypothetical protein
VPPAPALDCIRVPGCAGSGGTGKGCEHRPGLERRLGLLWRVVGAPDRDRPVPAPAHSSAQVRRECKLTCAVGRREGHG